MTAQPELTANEREVARLLMRVHALCGDGGGTLDMVGFLADMAYQQLTGELPRQE